MKPFELNHVTYRAMVINGHVGVAVNNGVIEWQLKKMPRANIAFVVEAGHQPGPIHHAFGQGWQIFPDWHPDDFHNGKNPMNYVAVRGHRRWVHVSSDNHLLKDIDPYPRRLGGVVLYDRRAKRYVRLSAAHVDPLGEGFTNANPHARLRHVHQVGEYVEFHGDSHPGEVSLSGGDWNEQTQDAEIARVPLNIRSKTATEQFSNIGMRPAWELAGIKEGASGLLELFANRDRWLEVRRWQRFEPPIQGIDHETVGVWLRVRKGNATPPRS